MGYYSDVRLTLSKKGYKKLRKYVDEEAKKVATPGYDCNLLNHTDIFKVKHIKDNTEFLIGWNYIKWYESRELGWYDDIRIIINGLKQLRDDRLSYHFSRIGEDLTDIDEDYWDDDEDPIDSYIYIERHFNDDDFEGEDYKEGGINI